MEGMGLGRGMGGVLLQEIRETARGHPEVEVVGEIREEVALQHGLDAKDRERATMVSDTVVGEVEGADTFTSFRTADLLHPQRTSTLCDLLHFHVEQTSS